jgi:hypothetical protein
MPIVTCSDTMPHKIQFGHRDHGEDAQAAFEQRKRKAETAAP